MLCICLFVIIVICYWESDLFIVDLRGCVLKVGGILFGGIVW